MDDAQYEDLAGWLYGLLIRLSDRMPADTAGWVHHVTEVGEYALAPEDLAAILAHGKTAITDQERADMLTLGTGMTLRHDLAACSGHARAQARITAWPADRPRHVRALARNVSPARGELMPAGSSLTAVTLVRALLNQDTESLTVLPAKVAARAEGIAEGEYLDRIIRLWTDGPKLYRAGNGGAARGSSVTERGAVVPMRADPGSACRRRRSARGSGSTAAGGQVLDRPGPGEFVHVVRLALAAVYAAVPPGKCRCPALLGTVEKRRSLD